MTDFIAKRKSEFWEEIAILHFAASHKDSSQIWAEDEVMNGFMYYHNSILVKYAHRAMEEDEFRSKYFMDGIDAYYDCYYRKYRIFIPNVKLEDFFDPYWQRHMTWEDKEAIREYSNVKTIQPTIQRTIKQPSYEKKKVVIRSSWVKN